MFASFKTRWWIVVAAMLGLTVSYGAISLFAFAVFLKPVSEDLGISRSLLTSGLFVGSLVCGLATPVLATLTDRWGSRRVLLPGIPLFALAVAAFSLLQPSPVSIYTLFTFLGLLGAAQSTVPYAKVISSWFDRERGVALAIAMSGMGISVAIVPQIATLLIQTTNWRMAYIGLGVTIVLLALVPVLLFVREPRPHEVPEREVSKDAVTPGLTVAEAIRGWRFWTIGLGYFVAVIATQGTLVHAVAFLTDRGTSIAAATAALSAAGVGMIAGRLVGGWLLDRFHGPSVAICFFVIPAVGIACLLSGGTIAAALGSLLCGIGLGAHVGLMAFFAGRYFGLRAYATIYGMMFGLFLIGGGVGPYLSSLSFDLLRSYEPALLAYIAGLLAMSLLFAPLGAYPYAAAARSAAKPALTTLTPEVQTIARRQ
jgi:MFS family permease